MIKNRELPIYCPTCGDGCELRGLERDESERLCYVWHCLRCGVVVEKIALGQ